MAGQMRRFCLIQIKLKEDPEKPKQCSHTEFPGRLTFTVGISDVHLSETGNSYTTKGKWPVNKLHSSLHVCLCLCDQGWKTSSGLGEDANSCIPLSGAPKLVCIRKPERFRLKVCIGIACLNGKKISTCLGTYQDKYEEEIPRHTYTQTVKKQENACQRYKASRKETDNLGIYRCSKKWHIDEATQAWLESGAGRPGLGRISPRNFELLLSLFSLPLEISTPHVCQSRQD